MLLCSVVAHIVAYKTTALQHYNTTKYLFLCFCSLLRSWQYPASRCFSGQCVAKRPCSPFHAQSAPCHRAQRAQRVGNMLRAWRCSWSCGWLRSLAYPSWQDVPCASKPRRYCIQGVCIRRVPPSRSMDIDRVTRLARHTGFGQPALLRLAPFCSRYNAGTFRLFKVSGTGRSAARVPPGHREDRHPHVTDVDPPEKSKPLQS